MHPLVEMKDFQRPHLPLNWRFYLLPFVLLATSDFCLQVGMALNMPDLCPHIRQVAPVSAAHSASWALSISSWKDFASAAAAAFDACG